MTNAAEPPLHPRQAQPYSWLRLLPTVLGLLTMAATPLAVALVDLRLHIALYRLSLCFVPLGALVCGAAAASGFYVGARATGRRPGRVTVWLALASSISAYGAICLLQSRVRAPDLFAYSRLLMDGVAFLVGSAGVTSLLAPRDPASRGLSSPAAGGEPNVQPSARMEDEGTAAAERPAPPGRDAMTKLQDETNTIELLEQTRAGDHGARNRLLERALPPLLKFARGRLPVWARGMTDTQDLVQDVVLRAMPKLESFNAQGPGALQAFLKRAVSNQIVDEIRKARRRRLTSELPDAQPDRSPSPLTQAIRRETRDRLRVALATLSTSDQALILERFERQRRYAEVAQALRKPNAGAARVAVERAVARLEKAMARGAAGVAVQGG